MKSRTIKFLIGTLFLFGTFSCETELDINADYKTIPIIYGLLDATESVHLIKINKTFLGNGNAFDFAKNPDSSSFANLNAVIEQVKNGVVVNIYQLDDTIIGGKDSGLFYSEPSKYYYFTEPTLNLSSVYRVKFMADGKEVLAETPIIGMSTIDRPRVSLPEFELVVGAVTPGKVKYAVLDISLIGAKNAALYEFFFKFYFTEVYKNGTSKERVVEISGGSINSSIIGAQNIASRPNAQTVFSKILSEVKPDDNVQKRIIGDFEYLIYSSGEEFSNYLQVNKPVTGVVLDKPEYTNVSNGIGIFNTRYRQSVRKKLGVNSLRAFVLLESFPPLKFCSTDPAVATDAAIYCK